MYILNTANAIKRFQSMKLNEMKLNEMENGNEYYHVLL